MISGRALFKLRQIKGLKQKHLAQKMGITQQALSKLEQNEIIAKEKFEEVLEALKIITTNW